MGLRGCVSIVQPFVSTLVNRLDAKGRVSVPAPFRQILTQQGTQGLYCIRAIAHPALDAFGDTLNAEFQDRLSSLDPIFDDDYDAQAQTMFGASHFLSFDDEGRVRIPDALIAFTGITERVTFVGLGRKFQIWDPARFEPVERARLERARALRRGAA